MLKEFENVSQKKDDPGHRRWFTGERLELITWNEQDELIGFQLCLDNAHALTWKKNEGESYTQIDDGDHSRKKMTPILVPNGPCPKHELRVLFKKEATDLDPQIKAFVLNQLNS